MFWKIKWENISFIIWFCLFLQCMIYHIQRNGFDPMSFMFEFLIYAMTLFMNYVAVYSVRQEFLHK